MPSRSHSGTAEGRRNPKPMMNGMEVRLGSNSCEVGELELPRFHGQSINRVLCDHRRLVTVKQ